MTGPSSSNAGGRGEFIGRLSGIASGFHNRWLILCLAKFSSLCPITCRVNQGASYARIKWSAFNRAAIMSLCATIFVPLAAVEASSGNGQSRITINQGVNIIKNADLQFGNFAAGTTQSRFRIDPVTDAVVQLSGNAVSLGGTRTAASFTAFGKPLERVRITVNQNRIDLTRVGGTETMRVDQLRLDGGNGSRNRTLDASGSAEYKLGGRLTINPNQAGGAYAGTFNITIEYQ